MKYGKIDSRNLEMKSYKKDTSVSAMVIGDIGSVRFIYDQGEGFHLEFNRHARIKIFKKEGYSFADQMLELYYHNKLKEDVIKLKAATYNLEGTKVVTSKINKKSSVFRDEINEYWNSFKFTLPDVKEGSIIEFEYTIKSNRFSGIPTWYFQNTIPVLWSEYNVEAPEFYIYKKIGTGYEPLQISQQTTGTGSITINYGGELLRDSGGAYKTARHTETEKYKTNKYRMVAIDVPPFIVEPMLTTKENYITKVKFEIARTEVPGQMVEFYTQTWESINSRLLENGSFGEQLVGGLFLNKPLENINASVDDPVEKMVAIHKYIQDNMKWDGYSSMYSSSLRSAYNEKSGTIGDINLMLILMLKKAGFETYPVVLSTRSHGFINKLFPSLSSVNYVIAMVKHKGSTYLMDASDPYCTVNMLPIRCLNGEGLVVEKDRCNWVNLNPLKSMDSETIMSLEMDQEGDFMGTIVVTDKDYAAANRREEIEDEKSEDDYIESFENSNKGLEVLDYSFDNIKDLYKPFSANYEVKISGFSDRAGDLIYINPMFYERMERNIFRIEERKYPIDFGSPIHDVFKLSLKIPEGFYVDELPESTEIDFGDKRLVFSYRIEENEGVITLVNETHINDILFLYNDYKGLKEFFNKIVEKHSEMVVLKKTEKEG